MIERRYLGGESQILKIGVTTTSLQDISVIVSDANQVNTLLTNRSNPVNGNQYFYIRLPKAPTVALVQVFNKKTGSSLSNDNFSMIGGGIWSMPLERKTAGIDITNEDVRSFVAYGQRFAYHAGHIPVGDYVSADGRIHFRYLSKIMGPGGVELNTPAQTGEITGEIEISQTKFQSMTVPERFAIMCHEFCHYYVNRNMYNEIEADMQGLNIYLGLGYPRYDAYKVFLDTFKGAATPLNEERKKKIRAFIDKFEMQKTVTLYD